MHTYDEDTLSDLHKDARGFRPSWDFWKEWATSSEDQKQVIYDGLVDELHRTIWLERQQEAMDMKAWEAYLSLVIDFAKTRYDALRWIIRDENIVSKQDAEHFVWKQGILFTEGGRKLVDEVYSVAEDLYVDRQAEEHVYNCQWA